MKRRYYALILSAVLIGCGTENYSKDNELGITGSSGVNTEEAMALNEEKLSDGEDVAQPVIIQTDKIIKTADIKFEVANYRDSKKYIDSLVSYWGGYISDENEYSHNYKIVNNITIRIANKNFENLLNEIGKTSSRTDYKRINSIDVSEEYIDIKARLKTKKEVESRYRALLKKAVKIEDILKIENEIRVIQEEIEAKEGRLKYLDSRVSFSTINLEIYQILEFKYKPDKEANFITRLHKALDKGWKGLLSFIIGILHIWPLLLIITFGLLILLRFQKKKNRRKASGGFD